MPSRFEQRLDDERITEGDQYLASDDSHDEANTALSDTARTPKRLREAAQELLKYGLLEQSRKPNLYRLVITNVTEIAAILEPLDLALGLDEVRGLAFTITGEGEEADQDDWSHPLVRRQRLNLEQSLLVAVLRQQFVVHEQEADSAGGELLIAIDDLVPQLQVYFGDLGSDAKERSRVITLLDQLKGHGLVSAPDVHERVTVRPIIAHLANPENLQALLDWLREQTGEQTSAQQSEQPNPGREEDGLQ